MQLASIPGEVFEAVVAAIRAFDFRLAEEAPDQEARIVVMLAEAGLMPLPVVQMEARIPG